MLLVVLALLIDLRCKRKDRKQAIPANVVAAARERFHTPLHDERFIALAERRQPSVLRDSSPPPGDSIRT
jgi:hypothetical protein